MQKCLECGLDFDPDPKIIGVVKYCTKECAKIARSKQMKKVREETRAIKYSRGGRTPKKYIDLMLSLNCCPTCCRPLPQD